MTFRRLCLILFSAALLGAGAYLSFSLIRCLSGHAHGVCHVSNWTAIAGMAMFGLGAFLLWDEFLNPRVRVRASMHADKNLLDAIVERQSPGSWRQRRPEKGGPQHAMLEGHLRNAILDRSARERLVEFAMNKTGGDRAEAICLVLRDLENDNKRWT